MTRIYATTDHGRLGAERTTHPDTGIEQVLVWQTGPEGRVFGFYDLDRFPEGNLTQGTLTAFFGKS